MPRRPYDREPGNAGLLADFGHLDPLRASRARFRAKACPALDAGWVPVRVKKTRQNKRLAQAVDRRQPPSPAGTGVPDSEPRRRLTFQIADLDNDSFTAMAGPSVMTNREPGQLLSDRRPARSDLGPEPGVAGRLDLEPVIVGALPRPDRFGEVVQHQVTFRRRGDENEMSNARTGLDDRQAQGFRGQAALQELVPLGDGVVVAVSGGRRDRPTGAVALDRRADGGVDVAVDALQQVDVFRVRVDAVTVRWIRGAVGGIAAAKLDVLKWGQCRRGFHDRRRGDVLLIACVGASCDRRDQQTEHRDMQPHREAMASRADTDGLATDFLVGAGERRWAHICPRPKRLLRTRRS